MIPNGCSRDDLDLAVGLAIPVGELQPLPDSFAVGSWVTILVVSRDVILLLGTAVAHFTDSRVDLTPTFLGKGTTFLQLCYVVLVIFLSSRHIDLAVILPLLLGMVSFTLLSGLHYLYRGCRHPSAINS